MLAIIAILAFGASSPLAAAQATPVASVDPLHAAAAWLVSQQDASGAFVGFSGEPDPGTTIDAVLALAAAGEAESDAVNLAIEYLTANGAGYAAMGAGYAAKLVMAMVAVGRDPANIGGLNAVELIADGVDEASGFCGGEVFDHALCMIGLVAAGQPVPAEWTARLLEFQIVENGGWAFDGSLEAPMADSNTTAIVVQALVAAGMTPDQEPIQRALSYLSSVLAPGGGFAYAVADPLVADANSTGTVIQALMAAGEDPGSAAWGNATAALTTLQNPSGAFRYMESVPEDNLYATLQAMPALAGLPFPIRPS